MAADPRSEAGATLVEILIAVAILGIGFVAVLGGMGTTFASSALHREQARAEAEVRRYAEAVKATSIATTCPASYTRAAAGFTDKSGFSYEEPVVVGYVNEATGVASATCSTTALQLVRVKVTSTVDTRAEETLELVKRPA